MNYAKLEKEILKCAKGGTIGWEKDEEFNYIQVNKLMVKLLDTKADKRKDTKERVLTSDEIKDNTRIERALHYVFMNEPLTMPLWMVAGTPQIKLAGVETIKGLFSQMYKNKHALEDTGLISREGCVYAGEDIMEYIYIPETLNDIVYENKFYNGDFIYAEETAYQKILISPIKIKGQNKYLKYLL